MYVRCNYIYIPIYTMIYILSVVYTNVYIIYTDIYSLMIYTLIYIIYVSVRYSIDMFSL